MALLYACEQVVEVDELTCSCDIPDDADLVTAVLEGASDILAILADAQIGRCTASYRPCRDLSCYPPACCWCCNVNGIHLPGVDPVVTEVLIDGAVVAESTYTTITTPRGVKVLARYEADGTNISWPYSQKLMLPSTQPDTFEITVETGNEITIPMKMAVSEIACEMFAGLTGEDTTLDGAIGATMFGLTINYSRFSDPTDQATMNLAGLNWVRRFINTADVSRGAQILAPEIDDGWELYQRAA